MSYSLDRAAVSGHEILLALENHALSSAGASATSSPTLPGLGAGEALSPDLGTAMRSSTLRADGDGQFKVMIDLGRARRIEGFFLHRHNVRLPWAVDVWRSHPSGSSPLYSSAWTDPIVRSKITDFPSYASLPYLLGAPAAHVSALAARSRLDSLILPPAPLEAIRYVQFRFDTSGIAQPDEPRHVELQRLASGGRSAGPFIQIGLLRVGRVFRPRINVLLDWSVTPEDRSLLRESDSGAIYGRRRAPRRRIAIELGYLEREEAFETLLSHALDEVRGGRLGRVFVWVEPEHPRFFYRQSMTATVSELPPIAMTNVTLASARGFVLREA